MDCRSGNMDCRSGTFGACVGDRACPWIRSCSCMQRLYGHRAFVYSSCLRLRTRPNTPSKISQVPATGPAPVLHPPPDAFGVVSADTVSVPWLVSLAWSGAFFVSLPISLPASVSVLPESATSITSSPTCTSSAVSGTGSGPVSGATHPSITLQWWLMHCAHGPHSPQEPSQPSSPHSRSLQ